MPEPKLAGRHLKAQYRSLAYGFSGSTWSIGDSTPVMLPPMTGLEKDVGIANVKAVIRLRDVSVTSLIVSRK